MISTCNGWDVGIFWRELDLFLFLFMVWLCHAHSSEMFLVSTRDISSSLHWGRDPSIMAKAHGCGRWEGQGGHFRKWSVLLLTRRLPLWSLMLGRKNGKPCPSLPNDRDSRTTSCSIRRWSVLRRGSSPILLFVCLHFLLQTRSRSDQVKKVASGANLYTDLALGDSACSFVNLSRLATLRENRLTSWQKHKFLTSCGLFQFSLGSSEPRRWWRRLSWPGEQTWKTKSVIIKSLKREKQPSSPRTASRPNSSCHVLGSFPELLVSMSILETRAAWNDKPIFRLCSKQHL